MKIYLDVCSIQRPLDTKTQVRIILEADAVLGIIAACETNEIELVSSQVLLFEINRNPNPTRRDYALEVLSNAKAYIELDEQTEKRAMEFIAMGIKRLDAFHLAVSEKSQADYFCTCDDKFLKKAIAIKNLQVKIISPIQLIQELES